MVIGLFETLVLVGLMLLIVVVAAIGYLLIRRQLSDPKAGRTRAAQAGETASDAAAVRAAESRAAAIVTEAEAVRRDAQDKADELLRATEVTRRELDDEARLRRNELREQRLEIERRE